MCLYARALNVNAACSPGAYALSPHPYFMHRFTHAHTHTHTHLEDGGAALPHILQLLQRCAGLPCLAQLKFEVGQSFQAPAHSSLCAS